MVDPHARSLLGERSTSWAIVLAAGSGSRFGAAKQFTSVAGQRLVDLAVRSARSACDHVVVVVPSEHEWDGPPVDAVVAGGSDRPASVRCGLAAIPTAAEIIIVHQAANPVASPAMFTALISAVRAGAPAAVPGLRPSDVVRRAVDGFAGELLGRDELILVQTPAAFRGEVLRAAHALDVPAQEDTALVSAAGYPVQLVPGDPRNIHVATPEDLELVRALLMAGSVGFRAGTDGDDGQDAADDHERTSDTGGCGP
jgi:2-C-methyl-D-erythritol 4-phosphate cytidylyltransferase